MTIWYQSHSAVWCECADEDLPMAKGCSESYDEIEKGKNNQYSICCWSCWQCWTSQLQCCKGRSNWLYEECCKGIFKQEH
ncbi:unnamed protein product [Prunus armeniaca]